MSKINMPPLTIQDVNFILSTAYDHVLTHEKYGPLCQQIYDKLWQRTMEKLTEELSLAQPEQKKTEKQKQ